VGFYLHGDAVKSLNDPTIRQRFETDGAEVVGSTPEQFAKFVVSEIAKWTRVVKQAGIKFE
jgi:tripartite-type tricarboxylate transporter receptor subunit TctC